MRAHRLGLPMDNLNMLSETAIEQICLIAEQEQPKLMVIDSIQVMHMADIQSSPGSVAQVRETAAYLTRFAKTRCGDHYGRPRHQRRLSGRAEGTRALY